MNESEFNNVLLIPDLFINLCRIYVPIIDEFRKVLIVSKRIDNLYFLDLTSKLMETENMTKGFYVNRICVENKLEISFLVQNRLEDHNL